MYIYRINLASFDKYEVGFYDPHGNWNLESKFYDKEKAIYRMQWLNGRKLESNIFLFFFAMAGECTISTVAFTSIHPIRTDINIVLILSAVFFFILTFVAIQYSDDVPEGK